jgi:hypothetical protein
VVGLDVTMSGNISNANQHLRANFQAGSHDVDLRRCMEEWEG